METKKKILLVEDEDNIAIALEILIGRMGHELHRVEDCDPALAELEARPADVAILDIMLPKRSGYEICRILRASEKFDATKVLLMTARGGEVERRKGMALGADAFMIKPFSNSELTDTIADLLGLDAHA